MNSFEHWIEEHRAAFRAGLVFACAVYLFMCFAAPLLVPDVYASDMNANLAWAHRFRDSGLFPGDAAIDYEQFFHGGLGFATLYGGAAVLPLPLAVFAKCLPVALGSAMLACGYAIGVSAGGERRLAGIAAALLLMALHIGYFIDVWGMLQGGLPRAFYYPLLLAAACGLLRGRDWPAALAAFAAALLYAPAWLVIGAMTAFDIMLERSSLRRKLARALVHAPGAALGGALLLLHAREGARFGAMLDWDHAQLQPVMAAGGIMGDVVAPTWQASLLATRFGVTWQVATLAALCGLLWLLNQRVPAGTRAALSLASGAICAHAAAYAFYFRLYTPARYSAALPIAAWLLLALTAGMLIERAAQTEPGARRWLDRFQVNPGVVLLCALVAFSITAAANFARLFPGPRDAGHTGLYRTVLPVSIRRAIAALPKDTVIAAHPQIAGDVPFLCRRSVFVDAFSLFPYHELAFAAARTRSRKQALALFATRWEPIAEFARATGVRYMLVDAKMFRQEYGDWSAAYEELRAPMLEPGTSFALANPPPDRVVLSEDGVALVRIDGRPN